jgi:osmotically-inducible protein OsmY
VYALTYLFAYSAFAEKENSSLAGQIEARILKIKKGSIENLKVIDKGDGYIVLQGTANLYGKKYQALKTAEKFKVKTIQNDIVVKPSLLRNDSDIERDIFGAIEKELTEDYFEDINFKIDNGVVQLSGTVVKLGLIDKIFDNIIWISGIRYVENNLKMAQVSPGDDNLRTKILDALQTNIRLTPYFSSPTPSFMIIVDAGRVTLKGVVGSEADKLAAEQVTRSVFGVKSVDNQLKIAQ